MGETQHMESEIQVGLFNPSRRRRRKITEAQKQAVTVKKKKDRRTRRKRRKKRGYVYIADCGAKCLKGYFEYGKQNIGCCVGWPTTHEDYKKMCGKHEKKCMRWPNGR